MARLSKEQINRIYDLLTDAKRASSDIAKEIGCSTRTIERMRNKATKAKRKRQSAPKEKAATNPSGPSVVLGEESASKLALNALSTELDRLHEIAAKAGGWLNENIDDEGVVWFDKKNAMTTYAIAIDKIEQVTVAIVKLDKNFGERKPPMPKFTRKVVQLRDVTKDPDVADLATKESTQPN